MKVKLDLVCRITYKTTVEMKEADYTRLKNSLENGSRQEIHAAEEELNSMMSERDYYDGRVEDVMNLLPVEEESAE